MTQTFIQIEGMQVLADQVSKPMDRTFREAWCLNGPVVNVDMEKARDIWRDKIREVRMPVLASLDARFMKALEAGDVEEQQRVASQKKALRDATKDPAIEAATTPHELQMVQPAGLEMV